MRAPLIILTALVFAGCLGDMLQGEDWRDGHYYVQTTPGGSGSKTLYIDLGNGSGHGRVTNVRRIGADGRLVIVESLEPDGDFQYWIIDRSRDQPALNSEEILLGPMDSIAFRQRLVDLGATAVAFTADFME